MFIFIVFLPEVKQPDRLLQCLCSFFAIMIMLSHSTGTMHFISTRLILSTLYSVSD